MNTNLLDKAYDYILRRILYCENGNFYDRKELENYVSNTEKLARAYWYLTKESEG